MLQQLQISNYALIEHLDISFKNGFSSVTGETGAGKSIILGALNLLLGKRADTSVLKNNSKKSIVEGHFDVSEYKMEPLFQDLDIDYDVLTIFRREILPSGKTRAFVNDVPVTLNVLKKVSSKLIDIHSQDNTHSLNNKSFQMKVVDAYAGNHSLRNKYLQSYTTYQSLKQQLFELEEESAKNSADLDYYKFQLEQLDEAQLKPDEQQSLEKEQDTAQHAEEIQSAFFGIHNSIEQEGGVMDLLNAAYQSADKSASHNISLKEITERLNSVIIELRDMSSEAESLSEEMEFSPARLEEITDRLSLIYELQQKHRLDSIEGLLELHEELADKVLSIASFDENIQQLKNEIESQEESLTAVANKLTTSRTKVIKPVVDFVSKYLKNLGMPNAQLDIECEALSDFTSTGKDDVRFLFSANKNSSLQEVGKVASGGEKSRLMFTIKLLLAKKEVLPTIIFDEIDTGVSGEVARKMGQMMREMGDEMQVMSITHLPQVASCAQRQYKVYKYDETDSTLTQITQLNEEERLEEIARLLSGDAITEAALVNAKELLN
jgi:DNA repair protein RecN (Recombination protein N)